MPKKMAKKKRIAIPKQTEKRAFQEVGSACAFCRESEIASLQVHHIDEDPSNNELENLLVVCGNCHGKITEGVTSLSDVMLQKRMAQAGALVPAEESGGDTVTVKVEGGSFEGNVANTINNTFNTPKESKPPHPPGSVGANLEMKGYISYLVKRYYEFRKADRSYGRKTPFSHAVIHTNVEKKFGYQTYYMPEDLFPDLVEYLQGCIDRTILCKNNRSKGRRCYHSYADHGKKRA